MTTKELIAQVTSLPVEDRAVLAEIILRSLNSPDAEIDKKWVAVAKRRLGEIRSGAVKPIPGEEVFKRIRKKFKA